MYALVDGNNFYVSCERSFRPSIAMCAPWFEIKHPADSSALVAQSANFALYGDMCDSMISVATELGPRQDIYSIDESFIDTAGVRGCLVERILKWVGIPQLKPVCTCLNW